MDSFERSARSTERTQPAAAGSAGLGGRSLSGKGRSLPGGRKLPRGRPLGGKRAKVGMRNLFVAASEAQREKVARMPCLVCGRTTVDAAHLVPQRLGGCTAAACAIPLCRACHKQWDAGGLDLRPYLGDRFQAELEHALTHVSADALERALSGGGWGLPRWWGKR